MNWFLTHLIKADIISASGAGECQPPLQLNESTDMDDVAQLLVYNWFPSWRYCSANQSKVGSMEKYRLLVYRWS